MIHTRRNSHSRRERQQAKSRQVRTQRRWLQPERLEERTLMSASPVHNDFWPEDVNNDLRVSALDALHVINAINAGGSQGLAAGEQTGGETTPKTSLFTDVSGDGILSPLDALRVVNTVNGGEGEDPPNYVVQYNLRATDLNGANLTNNTINVGDTFQLWSYVRDVRTTGTKTGVFAAYLDVLMTNMDLAQIRYGETQELRMDATRPGEVSGGYDEDTDFDGIPDTYVGGTFRLSYGGQTTADIRYYGDRSVDVVSIRQALEALSTIGVGNVAVSSLEGTDFNGRYFIRFKRGLGERDIAAMTVQGQGLQGNSFTPAPQIVDNYISVTPTTEEGQKALFKSSFEYKDPYVNGPSALDEPLEAGQPAGSRNLGEVGAFLNRTSLSPATTAYPVFTVEIRGVQSGAVSFSGNLAENNDTLVFKMPDSNDTKVPDSAIQFLQTQSSPLTITIAAPIVVGNDTATTNEDTAVSIPVLTNDTVNTTAGGVAPLSLVAGSIANITPAGSATVGTSGSNVSFTPTANFSGQVTFTYQVRDSKAGTPNTATGTVTVNVSAVNDAPTLTAISNMTLNEDPGEQTVNLAGISAGGGETQPLQVTVASSNTTLLPNLTVDYTSPNATGTLKFTPAANQSGSAVVTVTVTDGGLDGNLATAADNGTVSRSFTVTVNALNDPPVNTVPGAQTIANNAPFVFSAANGNAFSIADADGNVSVVTDLSVSQGTLTVVSGGGATITTPSATSVRIAGTVSQVNNALSQVTYTAPVLPVPGFVGTVTLTIDTNDQGNIGAPGPITDHDEVTLNVVPPRKPFATNDTATVAEDSGATTVNVLANDIDVTTAVGPTNLTITNVSDPAGGVVTIAADGKTVTYQPDLDFFGSDSFTYTIASTLADQGDGPHTGSVVVTVNGINDSPTITQTPTGVATAEDTSLAWSGANTLAVADVDADAGGGVKVTLGVAHGKLNAPNGAVTITGANSGSLTITGLVAAVNTSLAGLTYTPDKDYAGADSLNLTVDDLGHTGGGSASHTASRAVPITVTPVNDAPTIKAPVQAATKQDVNLTFAAGTANEISVSDVDSPQVTVTLTLANGGGAPGILIAGTPAGVTVTGNNSAAVTLVGSVAGVNAALAALTYDPAAGYEGNPTLAITATDGEFTPNATVGIIVSGINDPPVNVLPAPVAVAEDNDLFFNGNLRVTDPDAGVSTVEVTLSATRGVLTPVANPNVVVTPAGAGAIKLTGSIANINAALNGLKYRPDANYSGPAQLVISTNDKGNTGDPPAPGMTELVDTDTLAITVTPVNDAPVAVDDGSPEDRTLVLWNTTNNELDVLANDNTGPDVGETLTITNVNTASAHGTVTVQNGKLLYTPTAGYTGNAEIVYTVNDRADGSGLTDTATVYLTVVDFVPSDVSGYVYFDADDDGAKDPGEWGIGAVMMQLSGTNIQGDAVSMTAWTDQNGWYKFNDVLPSAAGTKYTLNQVQPAALVDGKDTAGDQGADMSANDQMKIFLPLFGYSAGILGDGNNFGELGFRSEYAAGVGLHELLHSGTNAGAFFFGTDVFGNVLWYMNAGGWDGYVPGRLAAGSASGFNATVQDGKLPLTERATGTVREINATDEAIRSTYNRTGGWVTRILGEADDFGLPAPLAAAGGEGEGSLTEADDAEMLAQVGAAADYESAVDAVLAGIA